jgi:long-chain fatty acid transport protein
MGPGLLAAYLQAGIVAGGGNLNFDDGTVGTMAALGQLRQQLQGAYTIDMGDSTSSFEASSIYYGINVGGAYSFLEDTLSVSLGGRLVIPRRNLKLKASFAGSGTVDSGTLTAEFSYNALGFTPILGFDVRPVEGLTLALRYEMQTQLEFEYSKDTLDINYSGSTPANGYVTGGINSILSGAGIVDGAKFKQNLPHIIGIGAEYKINDAFTASLSGTFYLLSASKMGGYDDYTQALGYDAALGVTYQVIEPLKLGAGVSYTESGIKDSYFNQTTTVLNASPNPPLDSIAFGLGATYSFNQNFDLGLAFLYSHYLPKGFEVGSLEGTYKKDVLNAGIGVGYHY